MYCEDEKRGFSMRKQECFEYSRRALLGASGALASLALLQPRRIFAQAGGGKLRIGIIGSGHIGGAIGGMWGEVRPPGLFSARPPLDLEDFEGRPRAPSPNLARSQGVPLHLALFFSIP